MEDQRLFLSDKIILILSIYGRCGTSRVEEACHSDGSNRCLWRCVGFLFGSCSLVVLVSRTEDWTTKGSLLFGEFKELIGWRCMNWAPLRWRLCDPEVLADWGRAGSVCVCSDKCSCFEWTNNTHCCWGVDDAFVSKPSPWLHLSWVSASTVCTDNCQTRIKVRPSHARSLFCKSLSEHQKRWCVQGCQHIASWNLTKLSHKFCKEAYWIAHSVSWRCSLSHNKLLLRKNGCVADKKEFFLWCQSVPNKCRVPTAPEKPGKTGLDLENLEQQGVFWQKPGKIFQNLEKKLTSPWKSPKDSTEKVSEKNPAQARGPRVFFIYLDKGLGIIGFYYNFKNVALIWRTYFKPEYWG